MAIDVQEFREHTGQLLDKALAEYVDEGEHQDGAEYWDQFDTIDEAWKDFVLYLGNITGVIE